MNEAEKKEYLEKSLENCHSLLKDTTNRGLVSFKKTERNGQITEYGYISPVVLLESIEKINILLAKT